LHEATITVPTARAGFFSLDGQMGLKQRTLVARKMSATTVF
jgi:hypothetical protein